MDVKKFYCCGVLVVSLLLVIWSNEANEHINEALPVIDKELEYLLTLKTSQPIYMKQEKLIEIGELQANEPIVLIGEDGAFYIFRLAGMEALTRKGSAVVEKKSSSAIKETQRLGAVKTKQQTAVYVEANGQSDVWFQLKAGYRYPVTRQEGDWYVIEIGERAGYIQKSSVTLDEGLPVLLYHDMLPRHLMRTEISTVSLEKFEQQMAYLAERKFTTVTAEQLEAYLEGRLVVENQAVVITFDDGLLSTKDYAYPVLKRHGFTALHHIISSRIYRGKEGPAKEGGGLLQYLKPSDLKSLNDVYSFEAHTSELHELQLDTNKAVVFEHSQEEIIADLHDNKKLVPHAISIAYPYGQYNEEFIAAAQAVGLKIGFTTAEGYANGKPSNFEVNRFGITEKRTFSQFTAYVDGEMTWPTRE